MVKAQCIVFVQECLELADHFCPAKKTNCCRCCDTKDNCPRKKIGNGPCAISTLQDNQGCKEEISFWEAFSIAMFKGSTIRGREDA